MSAPNIIFGAGSIGDTEKGFIYTWTTPETVTSLLSSLRDLDIDELDSAASYPPGNPWNTETLLGQAHATRQGFAVDTKILVSRGEPFLSADMIEKSTLKSLQLLNVSSVNILYAHAPDPNTSMKETAEAFHRQLVLGRCQKLGLCNWRTAQLEDYLSICETHGYTKPSVIQSNYNALYRQAESALFPLLRRHELKFYAYSPLAGGFLTGKVSFSRDPSDEKHQPLPPRSRWEGESAFELYTQAMDHDALHAIIRRVSRVCEAHGTNLTEASLRWLVHHSALTQGDGVILGATKLAQIQGNVEAIRKGPLEEDVRAVMEGLAKEAEDAIRVPALFKF